MVIRLATGESKYLGIEAADCEGYEGQTRPMITPFDENHILPLFQ